MTLELEHGAGREVANDIRSRNLAVDRRATDPGDIAQALLQTRHRTTALVGRHFRDMNVLQIGQQVRHATHQRHVRPSQRLAFVIHDATERGPKDPLDCAILRLGYGPRGQQTGS